MNVKLERTFTMGQGDIKVIVADYLSRKHNVECTPEMVKINIKDSTRYGGQFDEGSPADVTIVTVIDETP